MDGALRANVQAQLDRLLSQLEDLEELRDELSAEEYASTKAETLGGLRDFQASLAKMASGSMTLQSELETTRLAVQAAVSSAFSTPEVIRLFAAKQPAALRRRLAEAQRDAKLGKTGADAADAVAADILLALAKLGEPLSAAEEEMLTKHKAAALADFVAVEDNAEHVAQLPAAIR